MLESRNIVTEYQIGKMIPVVTIDPLISRVHFAFFGVKCELHEQWQYYLYNDNNL